MHDELAQRVVIPPPKGVVCPRCGGHRRFGGSVSVLTQPDGTTVMENYPGTPCGTCNGRGRVKRVDVVPFGDDE